MAEAEWKEKFKLALDVSDRGTKTFYDVLITLRAQIRNFVAHGAFGKNGAAFSFHSGAGAVPVLLTGRQGHRYSLRGEPGFEEEWAIDEIERFLAHLWSGSRRPARGYLLSGFPSILTMTADGTYAEAMESEDAMNDLVKRLTHEFDRAADMDW